MTSKFTNKPMMTPDEIADNLSDFLQLQKWPGCTDNATYCDLSDALYTLYDVSLDPFSAPENIALYEVLSAVAEKLEQNDFFE